MHRTALAFALAVAGIVPLGAFAAVGVNVEVDGRQFADAPVALTTVASAHEDNGLKLQQIVCISFRVVSERPLRMVKFAFSSLDAAGAVHQRLYLTREGTFAPGAEIKGYTGNFFGRADARSRAGCTEINPFRKDAPTLTIRLVAATFEDGSAWTAPEADLPLLVASPTPRPA